MTKFPPYFLAEESEEVNPLCKVYFCYELNYIPHMCPTVPGLPLATTTIQYLVVSDMSQNIYINSPLYQSLV